jgi:hypothetical protein
MDNAKAIDQMEVAYSTLLARPVQGETKSSTAAMAKDGKEHPRLVTLGGDHTIVCRHVARLCTCSTSVFEGPSNSALATQGLWTHIGVPFPHHSPLHG